MFRRKFLKKKIQKQKTLFPEEHIEYSLPEKTKIRIASFDIGKKNFAFCIEEVDLSQLLQIKNVPLQKRYTNNNTPTELFQECLNKVYTTAKTLTHVNSDLTKDCDRKLELDPITFSNANDLLNSFLLKFNLVDIFIIEQQMSFGNKKNNMACKLGQHCYSFFTFVYDKQIRTGEKQIIEFPAFHKTQVLGAPKIQTTTKTGRKKTVSIDQRARKKWSVEIMEKILILRGEKEIVAKKKDDLADVITQLQAFKYLAFIDRVM